MITNNNDNIAQQWFTLKSKKKRVSTFGDGCAMPITIAFTFAHLKRNLSFCFCFFFQLASSHHVAARCRLCAALDIPIKADVSIPVIWTTGRTSCHVGSHHRSLLNRKTVEFFFVIVYKYRNKINYSMLASYCCRLRVPALPPCQILCHRTRG